MTPARVVDVMPTWRALHGVTDNRIAMTHGIARAQKLGHRIGEVMKDRSHDGLLAECNACGLFLAVELAVEPGPFGGVLKYACRGVQL